MDDLLEIVKNGRKLQEFKWRETRSPTAKPTNINGTTFLNLAKLIDQRDEKTNLSVKLPHRFFTVKISADLLASVKNLKIEL